MRGRKPTPTAVLKLRGSWRAKARKDEPLPPRGLPRMPSDLTAEEQSQWALLMASIGQTGVLTAADDNAIAAYCRLAVLWRATSRRIKGTGGKDDRAIARMALQLRDRMLKLEQEFGLTPSARARLHVAPRQEDAASAKKARYLR